MSLREPFSKSLNAVVRLMPGYLEGALLLEHLPPQNAVQFLYQGKVYLVFFTERDDLLKPIVSEYDRLGKRILLNNDPELALFRNAYKKALSDFLRGVVKMGNTSYLPECYARYLLDNYQDVVTV